MADEKEEKEGKKADVSVDILGNKVSVQGEGSLDNIQATIEGPNASFLIQAKVSKNDDGYLLTGEGSFTAGILEGALQGSVATDENFMPKADSLNVSGTASISKEINGVLLNLSGTMENGSFQGLSGTITGPNGAYVIEASVVDNGGNYLITGKGAFASGPIQGSVEAQIQSNQAFEIDPSTFAVGGQVGIDQEIGGIAFSFTGTMENGSLAGLSGTVTGPNNAFQINAGVESNADGYTITGQGAYLLGPAQGNLTAQIQTDQAFNIDPSSLNIGGDINVKTEIAGNEIQLGGSVENGSLANLLGTVTGPNQSYLIQTHVVNNGENYTISGEGAFTSDIIQGQLIAQILTDTSFNIDPSSLNIGGNAQVETEVAGVKIHLSGAIAEGSLQNLQGVIEGPNGLFVIDVSVVQEGEKYTITGSGALAVGPVSGNLVAQIQSDSSFHIDPSSLNISGDAAVNTEVGGIQIHLSGAVENGRLAQLTGLIVGPNDFFTINTSVVDNGDSYTLVGAGNFTAGPVQGNLSAELLTDDSFNPQLDQSNISGDAQVQTELLGNSIDLSGSVNKGELESMAGSIQGPNGLYVLNASVVNNGETYAISGEGSFAAGPVQGNVSGEILTDKSFNPQPDSIQIGGDATVDTMFAGNHIQMSGTLENGSLQTLSGSIEGPNGMYLLNVAVANNGEGYTISGSGNFSAGPLAGTVDAQINTDPNFNPQLDSLQVGGEANVDTHIAGHHILMKGVMENGSLASLEGTVEGPNGLYLINASVVDNGDTYTITGEGNFANGPIQGSVHGTIDTDPNFVPDFSTLNIGGDAAVNTEVAGNKVNLTAAVNNGYLESISGTVEGPGGFYTIHAAGQREGDEGYDIEASGAFTFFEESYNFDPPPILLPVGVPGINIEISGEVGFGAKASADIVTGFKTDPHFIPDFSTFEVRSASLIGHGEVSIGIFGGISAGLPFAKVSAGIKAELKGIIDAILTLTADSKGLKVSGSLYAALLGALYAAVKLKFLFFKKEFDFLIVEGKVASVEKDFGPTDFTMENVLKGFAFGMDDISIPGKDPKAKPPELKDKEESKEVEEGKSEDEESKEEESEKESDSTEETQTAQMKTMGGNSTVGNALVQRQSSSAGLPSNLQRGVEKLSGQNMSDVQVHKNSPKPAQLQAHAYAQGNQIHLGPGQEKHLPHEAWHVAQQKQGRVQPTKQFKSDVLINDDEGLEKEADIMGDKALSVGNEIADSATTSNNSSGGNGANAAQLKSKHSSLQNNADQNSRVAQLLKISSLANHNPLQKVEFPNVEANTSAQNEMQQNSENNISDLQNLNEI